MLKSILSPTKRYLVRVSKMNELPLPNGTSPVQISDFAELTLLLEGGQLYKNDLVMKFRYNRRLEKSANLDFEVTTNLTVEQIEKSADLSLEADKVLTWEQLEERQKLYGINPPYEIEGDKLISKCKFWEVPDYGMQLLLAVYGAKTEAKKTGALFEKLVKIAVCHYLGGNAKIIGTELYLSKIKKFVELSLFETFIEKFDKEKDAGVDILAWKSFGDARGGQVILLVQCASGKYWEDKLNEVNLNYWAKHIQFYGNPIRAFALPYSLDSQQFKKSSGKAGIIFDRPRLYKMIQKLKCDNYKQIETDIKKWCCKKIWELKSNEVC